MLTSSPSCMDISVLDKEENYVIAKTIITCDVEEEEGKGLSSFHNMFAESDTISEITPPEISARSSNHSNNYNILGVLLNSLFDTKKPKSNNEKQIQCKVNEVYAKNLHIQPKTRFADLSIVNKTFDLMNSINKRDTIALKSIINYIFTEDCSLKTAALKQSISGRHYIFEMFQSMMRCSEDLSIEFNNHIESDINGNSVITFNLVCKGIFTRRDCSDNLWDEIANNLDRSAQFEILQNRILMSCPNTSWFGNDLINYSYFSKSEGTVSWILTQDNQFVKSYISTTKSMNYKFPKSSHQGEATTSSSNSRLTTKKVLKFLVVDESVAARKMLCHMLISDGHIVQDAVDESALIASLEQKPSYFDIIVIDINISKTEASSIVKTIRSKKFKGIILGVTDLETNINNFIPNHATYVMYKPVSVDSIRLTLKQVGFS